LQSLPLPSFRRFSTTAASSGMLDESISEFGAWLTPVPWKRLRLPISPSNARL
jgi:hypothetical protein